MSTPIEKVYSIRLAVQGENATTPIEIDMTTWAEEFPNANFYVLFKPYNEPNIVPVITEYDAPILKWIPTSSITAIVGVGFAEVRAVDASTGLIKKSRIIPTSIENSVSGNEGIDPPAAYVDWVNSVLAAKDEVVDAMEDAEDAQAAAEDAQTAAEAARDAAQAAAGDFQGLTATVSGLDAGASPTVNVTHSEGGLYNMAFGIPKGDKGNTGDPAPADQVQPAVNAYLASVITNPDSPPLDRTLSATSAAAPADMVGDLKSAIKDTTGMTIYSKAIGGFASETDGKTYMDANNRIRINEYIGIDDIVSASQPSGYWLYYYVYDDALNKIYNTSTWRQTTAPLLFADIKAQHPTAAFIRLMMRASSNAPLTESDKDKLVITQTTIKDELDEFETKSEAEFTKNDERILLGQNYTGTIAEKLIKYRRNPLYPPVIEAGGISSSGFNSDNPLYARTNNRFNNDAIMIVPAGYNTRLYFYENSTFISPYVPNNVYGDGLRVLFPDLIASVLGYTSATHFRAIFSRIDNQNITSNDIAYLSANIAIKVCDFNVTTRYPNITKRLTFTTDNQIQYMAAVNGKIWQSTASKDDHSDFGKIYVFDPSLLIRSDTVYTESSEAVRVLYHNLGHGGISGYNARLDLGIAMGIFDETKETIFVKNMASKNSLDVNTDSDIIHLDLGGARAPIYGHTYNTIMQETDATIRTFVIGLGENDLSVKTDGYGSFISGCAESEFNGTVMLANEYPKEAFNSIFALTDRTYQTLANYNGRLFCLTGSQDAVIYEYTFAGDEYSMTNQYICTNYDSAGDVVYEEPEGLAEINGKLYMSTWFNDDQKHFCLYELSLT